MGSYLVREASRVELAGARESFRSKSGFCTKAELLLTLFFADPPRASPLQAPSTPPVFSA